MALDGLVRPPLPDSALAGDAPPEEGLRHGSGEPPSPQRPVAPRRRRLIAAVVMLALIVACTIGFVMASRDAPPSTPLGATGKVPGGVARIDGALPLEEVDGWETPPTAAGLATPAPDGLHRVRVLLDLISLDEAGIRFDGADYAIGGIGVTEGEPLWTSVPATTVPQGQRIGVELVFEVPDKAVALVLIGPGSTRLALGAGHSTH